MSFCFITPEETSCRVKIPFDSESNTNHCINLTENNPFGTMLVISILYLLSNISEIIKVSA